MFSSILRFANTFLSRRKSSMKPTDEFWTLESVAGHAGRGKNTLLTTLGIDLSMESTDLKHLPLVVYLGGDVQNTRAKMEGDYDGYVRDLYSYDSILDKLRTRFPNSHIFLITPASHIDGFAHYSNFFKIVDKYGTPKYSFDNSEPLEHLVNLLKNGQLELARRFNRETLRFDSNQKLTLIGFSKGCTVVNQLLIAASSLKTIDAMPGLQLDHVVMLDSGHCGLSGAYLDDPKHLTWCDKPLVQRVSIGATNYELRKTWINAELPRFIEQLEKLGVEVKRVFLDGTNLRDHFEVHNALWDRKLGPIDG